MARSPSAGTIRAGAEVEQHVRLVPDQLLALDGPDPVEDPPVERSQGAGVERRAAGEGQAGRPRGPGPGLIQQVEADGVLGRGESGGNVAPRSRVAVLQADSARPRVVGPEVVERAQHRRHAEVVAREAELRLVRQAVVLDRPVRPALPLEALVVEVLVEVELAEDAVLREGRLARGNLIQVAVVIAPRAGLHAGVDHAKADDVEPVSLEEGGIVSAEASCRRVVRRTLEDHVDPVHDHCAALGVRDPAAGVAEWCGGRCLRQGGQEQEGERNQGRDRSPHSR